MGSDKQPCFNSLASEQSLEYYIMCIYIVYIQTRNVWNVINVTFTLAHRRMWLCVVFIHVPE